MTIEQAKTFLASKRINVDYAAMLVDLLASGDTLGEALTTIRGEMLMAAYMRR